jgi:hypothetical protein
MIGLMSYYLTIAFLDVNHQKLLCISPKTYPRMFIATCCEIKTRIEKINMVINRGVEK